jgi:hypothetical protein
MLAGATTISASPAKTWPSAETITTFMVLMVFFYWSFLAFSTASSMPPTM